MSACPMDHAIPGFHGLGLKAFLEVPSEEILMGALRRSDLIMHQIRQPWMN